jgi:hypothetical protein
MNWFNFGSTKNQLAIPFSHANLSPQEKYARLLEYYENNDLYSGVAANSYYTGYWVEAMKPLRGVVNRSVEFYAQKICPSSPEIITDHAAIIEPLEQFFKWSNFSAVKQLASRNLALYGDHFWKLVTGSGKVYATVIEPAQVTSFEVDARGNVVEIRIDTPIEEDGINKCYTEYWNKDDGYYATWIHTMDSSTALDQLGEPKTYGFLAEFGIDFLPFIHVKFRDVGKLRGIACTEHALDKLDEANREATRLAQMLFRYNKPLWVASANDKDAMGRPMPAPKVKTTPVSSGPSNNLETEDNSIIYMPGLSTLQTLIPPIDYNAALAVLDSMMSEIRADLPELNYYEMKDGNLSGKAIKLLLAAALDRATEAQENFLQGLIRLDEMALTIGAFMNIFSGVGNYENGDFDHSIHMQEPFPVSIDEQAMTVKTFVDAGLSVDSAMKLSGFSQEEIDGVMENKAKADASSKNDLASALMGFNRGNNELPTGQ